MNDIKKIGIEFLSSLEGYHQKIKEIHWSTQCKSEHLLTDEIDGDVLDYEDKIAENIMGIANFRIGIGDLKTLLPNSSNLKDVLKEMDSDVEKFKDDIDKIEKHNCSGLLNILDDFSESINKWKYLETFK